MTLLQLLIAALDELERLLTMAETWKAVLEQRGDALP